MQRSETPPDRRPENEARMTGGQLLTTQHMKFGDLILIFRFFYRKIWQPDHFSISGTLKAKKLRLTQNPSEIAVQSKDLVM